MKAKFAVVLLAAAFGFAGIRVSSAEHASTQVTTFQVEGITPGSAQKIEKLLGALPGVAQVKVSEELGVAVVVYDPVKAKADEFSSAMKSSGYLSTLAKANFRCPHCTATYTEDGECIICNIPLEPVSQG